MESRSVLHTRRGSVAAILRTAFVAMGMFAAMGFGAVVCSRGPEEGKEQQGQGHAAGGATADDPLQVTLEPSQTQFRIGDEIELTIRIVNHGDSDVVWGQGSSRCRLSAMVLVDGQALQTGPPVPCTMDMRQYVLSPGESDEQTWVWNGTVLRQGRPEALAPGAYQVYGVGGATHSPPQTITLSGS